MLDRVREVGQQHQRKVTTELGQQVQRAVFRFMQGLIDHPANRRRSPTRSPRSSLARSTRKHSISSTGSCSCSTPRTWALPVDMLTYREGYAIGQIVRLARDEGPDGLAVLDPNGPSRGLASRLVSAAHRGGQLARRERSKPMVAVCSIRATELIDRFAWGNATIAEMLEAQTVVPAPRGQVGKVRLSYRELNVEQLGSIYEGLLELAPEYAHQRLWEVELDTRLLHLTDAQRETTVNIRGGINLPVGSSLELIRCSSRMDSMR